MSGNQSRESFSRFKELSYSFLRVSSEAVTLALIRSVPFIGPALAADRKSLQKISSIFESDEGIQEDINKVVENLEETEEIITRLKMHIEIRRNDLQQALIDYERFSELAHVEKKNAQPLLKELARGEKKGIFWGLATNFIMVIIGIILAHLLRIWFPGFLF